MTRTILPFAALLLATAAGQAGAQPSDYRAVGTEPFWSVSITPQRMRFEGADGQVVSVPTPRPRLPRAMGRVYSSRQMWVSIHTMPCSDGMSDRIYQDHVTVTLGTRRLTGCGGTFVEPVNLTNTYWRITAINNRAVRADGPYRLDFTADRLSGQAGCNSFRGIYRIEVTRLTPGPIMSTRMACRGVAMANEQAALRVLRGPVTVSRPSEQVLELSGPAGSISLRMVPGAHPRN